MSQTITTASGDSVEVPDMRDLNRFLWKALTLVVVVGGGAVWAAAAGATQVSRDVDDLDRRVTRVEEIQPEIRELSRQMDSLRITLRESIIEIRRLRP